MEMVLRAKSFAGRAKIMAIRGKVAVNVQTTKRIYYNLVRVYV